jgi:hypothetical protein
MRNTLFLSGLLIVLFQSEGVAAEELPKLTTLSNPSIPYRVPDKPYVVLKKAQIEAVIVDNRAVNDEVLPGHRAGYHGVASLKHTSRLENIFVPPYAGLNLVVQHHFFGTTFGCRASQVLRCDCVACSLRSR